MPGETFIKFGRKLIVIVLDRDPNAQANLPSRKEVCQFQAAVELRHPALKGVWACADGLKLRLQQSSDCLIQGRFYNGWTHDHYVSCVFVFAPDGTIRIFVINAPGSMHDSQISHWGGIYKKLKKVHEQHNASCVVDSAFAANEFDFLIKSAQNDPVTDNPRDLVVNQQATAFRQASEWGMRALQGSFPRLKDRFLYEENRECKVMLQMIVYLFNYRTRLVGLNQILNTYMPELGRDADFLVKSLVSP